MLSNVVSVNVIAAVVGLLLGYTIISIVFGVIVLKGIQRMLDALHDDNIETAKLLLVEDAGRAQAAAEAAVLLVLGDENRAADVAKTAEDLTEADQTVVRKVTQPEHGDG